MSLLFRPGLPTSSLASRDPHAQYRLWRGLIPAITHSSHPSSTNHIISRRHNPKPTTTDRNTNRRPTPFPDLSEPYKGRPPITLERRTDSQRKALRRKVQYLHQQIPKSTPNPRCARLRIWYKDARMRRRQIKEKVEFTRQVNAAGFNQLDSALLLFRLTASLHNVSVVDPAQSPTQPHSRQCTTLKRKRQTMTSQLHSHIGPLTPHGNFFSIDDPP